MIGIFSKSEHDISTEDIIDWLHSQQKKYVRINGDDTEQMIELTNQVLGGKDASDPSIFDQLKVIWFRRWSNGWKIQGDAKRFFGAENLVQFNQHLKKEEGKVESFFFHYLKHKKWLSHPSRANLNKLIVLNLAKKNGLNIPETKICTRKKEVVQFLGEVDKVISKCISDSPAYMVNQALFTLRTTVIDEENVEDLDEVFFPSLLQEYIPKKYEIRSFFLNGEVFSMAIFSQSNEKTKIDFRNYDNDCPNRNVPYHLPELITEKIKKLMQNLEMKTGSIDLVRAKDGNYYFLEINPVGQFGMVSYPCNYRLEKRIAQYLMEENESI